MVTRRALALALALGSLTGCGSEPPPPDQAGATADPTSQAPPRGGTLSPTTSPSSTRTTNTTRPSQATRTEGRPTADPGTTGTPRGGRVAAGTVEDGNAAAVANAYVRTTLTIDTQLDNSHADAQRRAKRWLTPDLADTIAHGLPGSGGWARLKKDDTWTKVTTTDVTPAGGDPTKGLEADRLLEATVDTHTKGRKKPTTARTTMAVTLTRESESKPWRVSKMQTY